MHILHTFSISRLDLTPLRLLPPAFNGVLPWGLVDNRPYLRCLHGFFTTDLRKDVGVVIRRKHQATPTRYISMCRHNSLLPSARIGHRHTISAERTCFRPFSRSTSRSSPTPMSRTMPLRMDGSVWSASRKWWRTSSHAVIMDRESPAYSAPTRNAETNSSGPLAARVSTYALPVLRNERSSSPNTWKMIFCCVFPTDS